jgi:polyisoprenoid-binding protein YceI
MARWEWAGLALAVMAGACVWHGVARAEKRAIDVARSVMKVRVYKAGLFSAFGHQHEVEAPIAVGELDDSAEHSSVALRVDAGKLRVLDPGVSDSDRAQVQKTMESDKVLDAGRFPAIRFESTSVEAKGADRWTVHGNLTLRGQTRPVQLDVARKDGHYRGSAILKQREFGITPISVAGGAVRVKDEVRIEFDIVAAP